MKHAGSASTLQLLASAVALQKRKLLCSTGGLLPFTKWYFPEREGMDFIEGPHHVVIGETLDRVLRNEIPRLIITLPPGYTKAIDGQTPMWTQGGWRLAGDLSVGDHLMGADGQWTRIKAVVPQGVKPAFAVKFSDGTEIVACDDHRWVAESRYSKGHWKTVTTKELRLDLRTSDGAKKWRIPTLTRTSTHPTLLPIAPYLLGVWLGDGHSSGASITTMDDTIVAAFAAAGYRLTPHKHQNAGKATTYYIHNGFHLKLKSLGLIRNKHIPLIYKQASGDQLENLLQGLGDTDGCVSPHGQENIALSHVRLARDLREVICLIGGVWTGYDVPAASGKVSYRTHFRLPVGRNAFTLERKTKHQSRRQVVNTPRRFVDTISSVAEREMVCFAVDADDHLFCAGKDMVITHNTEMAVINFVSKGFQINPNARFIHASFSDQRALENSQMIKELVERPEYQEQIDPDKRFTIAVDSKAKDRWKTTAGGGMLAKAAGGPITGFRAGYMDKTKFTGALVIDDPLKPDDAFSPAKREAVNRRATNTFRSRLAHEGVPIVVIMQRLHSDDFVGHLLRGGSGDKWYHLDLPVLIESADAEYPKEWTHGIPIPHNLPLGPLWAEKHSLEEIEVLKADTHTYNSQYRQRPTSVEGALFNMDAFGAWIELPLMDYFMIYGDTALKTAERNDYSVLQLWGKAKNRTGIYLVDQIRGKWEAPELEKNSLAFYNKYRWMGIHPRAVKIEDKASGTGLIQGLRRKGVPIIAVQRERDKYTRGLDAQPWVETGQVWLPKAAPFTLALLAELASFDGLGTGHDDQVDPMMDAINEMLTGNAQINLDNL